MLTVVFISFTWVAPPQLSQVKRRRRTMDGIAWALSLETRPWIGVCGASLAKEAKVVEVSKLKVVLFGERNWDEGLEVWPKPPYILGVTVFPSVTYVFVLHLNLIRNMCLARLFKLEITERTRWKHELGCYFCPLEVALLVDKCWENQVCSSFHFARISLLEPEEVISLKKHPKTRRDFGKCPTNCSTKFLLSRWSASPTRGPFWRGGSDVPQMGFWNEKNPMESMTWIQKLSCWNSTVVVGDGVFRPMSWV